jgi:hypothetical protein
MAYGQTRNSPEVKLLVQPFRRVQFILNDTERLKEVYVPAVRLTAGDHRLIFWAPNCSILDTTLHVVSGKDMELRKVLHQTPEFLAYKRDHFHVGMKKALWKGVPLLFTIGFGIKALSDHQAHDQAFDDLHALRDNYATLTSHIDIEALKRSSIPAAQDKLDATRHQLILSLTLCGVGVLATVYGFIRAGRLAYPEYEDKERIRFEGLAWVPTRNGGMYLAGLCIPLR